MTAFAVPENLAFDNYTDLSDAIADWMDRSDLTGSVQSMIALAEARMRRLLQPLFAETTTDVAVTDGIGVIPTDCDIIRLVSYNGGELLDVSPQHGRQFPDGDAPRGFSLEANTIKVWPAVTATISVLYHPKLVSLSEASPTNGLLSRHPDLYFFGAMMFAEGYVSNDPRAATFKALWDEALAEAMQFFGRQRRVTTRLSNPAVVV